MQQLSLFIPVIFREVPNDSLDDTLDKDDLELPITHVGVSQKMTHG